MYAQTLTTIRGRLRIKRSLPPFLLYGIHEGTMQEESSSEDGSSSSQEGGNAIHVIDSDVKNSFAYHIQQAISFPKDKRFCLEI